MNNGKGQEKTDLVHNRIFIEEDKEFTLDEFAHLVARAVRSVASVDIDKDEVVYSRDDVYFTIVDVLGYINERTPGRFKFDQTSFQSYLVHYVPGHISKRKTQKGLVVGKAQSALHIKAQTGELPIWAENDDAVMAVINDIQDTQDTPKSAPATNANVLETQSEAKDQIERLAQEAATHYLKTGDILPSVSANITVLRRFYEIVNKAKEEETDG